MSIGQSSYYILKDHLGSWTTITNAEGNVEQELSFDAWGNLRDADTWTGTGPEAPMFDRGYTGHEHITAFGLINMNGRCYDPLMSSFLSVDEYVQDPTSAQNFNRYAYCLNNPLKYTDPSGWMARGLSHSEASEYNRYRLYMNACLSEEQWANTGINRMILARIKLGTFLDMTPFMMGEEQKGGGGGIVIKGNDGVLTPYSIGMRYEGNDSFTSQTVNYLNQVAEKSKTANRMLSELIASGYTYTIEESEDEKNGYEPNKDTPHYMKYNDDGTSMECYEPGNGTIKFNLNGQKVFEKRLDEATSKQMCRPYMGLMHELGHAWDHMAGVLANENEIYKGLEVREWMAVRTENAIRTELGLPVRCHYGRGNYLDGEAPPSSNTLYRK